MSKENAMSMLTGEPVSQVNPSVVVGELPPQENGELPPSENTKLESDRFAKLAAREARLQKEREMFKSEQQKVYDEKKKLEDVHKKLSEFNELKAKDPVAALKNLGFSEEDIFNFLAQKETKEPTAQELAAQAAMDEVQKFKNELAEKEKAAATERDAKNIQAFKDQIGETISKEAEKFEYCNYYGPVAQEIVFETVLEIIKEEPEIPPHQAMKEAIEAVEKFYEEEDKAMSALKKRKPPVVETPQVEEKKPLQKQTRPVAPTLNNKATATVASSAPKKETPQQKRERLELWLKTGQKPG